MPQWETDIVVDELLKSVLRSVEGQMRESSRALIDLALADGGTGVAFSLILAECRKSVPGMPEDAKAHLNRVASLMRLEKPFPDL